MPYSMQDKILEKLDPLKRKLFETRLEISGHMHKLVRIRIGQEDDFGDTQEIFLDSVDYIIAEMELPDKIPGSRLRKSLVTNLTVPTTSIYLYDILPGIMRVPFSVDLQKKDILVKIIQDEDNTTEPFLLTMQVVEQLIDSSPNEVVNIEYQIAPYINRLPTEIAEEVHEFIRG